MELITTQATMSSREIAEHLYVCHFSNGHIKVGRSCRPKLRIAAHVERVSCLGVSLVDHHVVECVGDVLQAESALIAWCRGLAYSTHKNEWFIGIDFGLAVAEANRQASEAYERPIRKQRSAADLEKQRQAFVKWDEISRPKKLEMEIPFLTARLIRDVIVLQMVDPDADYQPSDEFHGVSRFELLAAIYVATADREGVASLFHEAVVASGSAELRADLLNELSECALLDAKNAGIHATATETAVGA